MFSLAPRTPHARLRNENSTHFPSGKAFPKTPLPSAKQILGMLKQALTKENIDRLHSLDSTSGKPIAGPTIQLRKALGDKTPGTHLQNRGLKFAVQTPGAEESLPFLSDSDSDSEASTEPVHTLTKPSILPTSKKAPIPTRTRLPITRRTLPPPPAATVRTTKVAAAAAIKPTPTVTGNGPSKRTVISVPAIAARRKSGTTSALRIPLRNPATGPAAPATRSTRSTRPVPTAADKGKARAPLLPPAKQQPSPHDDYALRHLPPALRGTDELAFDDFRFDV
ncbi:hypothetical protein M408DRAFT_7125 [Serendipita vermifera MAFF 305830]|uniref:Uncharacterized protein n=1 Tax=Serendipita vermifera MAFF 305830 TaxID=933852 RepID=A0A0C3BGN6_SERVB|nr:hypothetical protein M408DRAFT_7125 [Serendipita vermifera MAFF 305830]